MFPLFFFFCCTTWLAGSQFLNQGLELVEISSVEDLFIVLSFFFNQLLVLLISFLYSPFHYFPLYISFCLLWVSLVIIYLVFVKNNLILFMLLWVFIAAYGLSPAVVSRGLTLIAMGLSLQWLLCGAHATYCLKNISLR